jgi:hypothetical protein
LGRWGAYVAFRVIAKCHPVFPAADVSTTIVSRSSSGIGSSSER